MRTERFHIQFSGHAEGFTLIELIMVIVLLGIIGMLGGTFIAQAFRGFAQSDKRMEIYEEGKIALVRMEREIRHAIPNAFALPSGTDLRFGLIDEVAMRGVFGRYTEDPPATTMTDAIPASTIAPIISVYNRSWNDFTTMVAAQRRLYAVSGTPPGMVLSKQLTPPRSSPRKRYYAVGPAVRYFLSGTTLMRAQLPITAENLDINANLPLATGYPLAQNVTPLAFAYTPASLTRNAIVTLDFTISRNGESATFHKEVHIANVP